jgi:hypothetical protein
MRQSITQLETFQRELSQANSELLEFDKRAEALLIHMRQTGILIPDPGQASHDRHLSESSPVVL